MRTEGCSTAVLIAEIGTSHNGSLKRARRLIEASAEAGADCVKTQIVFADEIIHPNTGEVALPGGSIRLYDRFRELEQDFSFYKDLKDICSETGVEFMASPFGMKSLEWLLQLGCDSIKIASPELNHFPLLREAAASGKKLILSTGVSKLRDIEAALETVAAASPAGAPEPVLLHCITAYPAPEEEYNLRVIPSLKSIFGVVCGVSDHSRGPLLVPAVSAALGAAYIEKHITLTNSDGGLDDPIALTPDDFRRMAELTAEAGESDDSLGMLSERLGRDRVRSVLGSGVKRLSAAEAASYGRTNRSVHALTALPAGTVLSRDNTALLRTEKKLRPGLRPELWDSVIGKKLVRPVESGEGIVLDDISRTE